MSKARDYLVELAARGTHNFSIQEMAKSLGVSHVAAKLALNRLTKQGLAASPARGFYVIVPPEYKQLGCLPAEQFIPALMERLKLTYYAGLLVGRPIPRSRASTAPRISGPRGQEPATYSLRSGQSFLHCPKAD